MNTDEIERIRRSVNIDQAPQADPRLGTIEDAHQTVPGKPKRWTQIGFGASLTALLVCIIKTIDGTLPLDSVGYLYGIFGTLTIMFLFFIFVFADGPLGNSGYRHFFFIYTNGFIVEKRDKGGAVLEQQTVCFDDVDSLDLYIERISSGNIRNDLKVFAPGARLLYTLASVDADLSKKIAVEAIQNSWLACMRKRAMDEFHHNGYVTFANIKIGRGRFIVDGKDWFEGMARYTITDMLVTIFPADPQQSPYYNKLKNPTGAWAIDISRVNNKLLFKELFNEFFGDRLR